MKRERGGKGRRNGKEDVEWSSRVLRPPGPASPELFCSQQAWRADIERIRAGVSSLQLYSKSSSWLSANSSFDFRAPQPSLHPNVTGYVPFFFLPVKKRREWKKKALSSYRKRIE